jgi:hypothetical protein
MQDSSCGLPSEISDEQQSRFPLEVNKTCLRSAPARRLKANYHLTKFEFRHDPEQKTK